MNERIRELAREAGLLTHNPAGRRTKLDVFAELLVQECVEVTRQYNFHERSLIAMYQHFGMDATEIFKND